MGRVSGPITINIIDIPAGAFASVISKGLILDNDNKVMIDNGSGLRFDPDGRLEIDTGNSLSINNNNLEVNSSNIVDKGLIVEDNKISVSLGAGLELDENNKIAIYGHDELAGEGLKVDDIDGKLDIKLGKGLIFNNKNEIDIDQTPDYEMMMSFTSLTETDITIENNIITVKKTYTRFDLHRNSGGIIVGINNNNQEERIQDITLPVGGYGYGGFQGLSIRENTSEEPNFYIQ